MTIWIKPNLTEKGGHSVSSGSKVVHRMRLPRTRELVRMRAPPGGPSELFIESCLNVQGFYRCLKEMCR